MISKVERLDIMGVYSATNKNFLLIMSSPILFVYYYYKRLN